MIFKSLWIILILILAGLAGRRFRLLDGRDHKALNSYLYYFALPALFFVKIFKLEFGATTWILVAGSGVPIVILLCLCLFLKQCGMIKKDTFVLLGLSVVFGSNAFFGIPFFEALMGKTGLDWAVFTAALLGLFGVISSLLLFEYATQKKQGLGFIRKVLSTPMVAAIALALTGHGLKLPLEGLIQGLDWLGKTAPGLAIFSLGMFIYDHFSWDAIRRSVRYAGFRVLFLPAATWLTLFTIGEMDPKLWDFLFLQSGIPAAVSLFIFAQRYQYKISEVGGIVISTSLFSIVLLGILSIFTGLL